MAFRGWPPAAIEFFAGLEADNSRRYWQANSEVYHSAVRAPMEALLADLAAEHGEGKVFRPNRDVRFSRDKSPYKTNIAAVLDGGGYVQLSAAGLSVGRGYYLLERDQLERYRQAVDDDATGVELARIVAGLRAGGMSVTAHDVLKTAPRGVRKDHPRIELLRHKGLIGWKEWPPGPWLATAEAGERVEGVLRAARPLSAWLDRHVGPPAAPTR